MRTSELPLNELADLLIDEANEYVWVDSGGERHPYRIASWADLHEELFWTIKEKDRALGRYIPGVGVLIPVEDFGGEGQGDSLWYVFKVIFPDGVQKLLRMDGYYSSYQGGEYDGNLVEVKAVDKTITVYEKV